MYREKKQKPKEVVRQGAYRPFLTKGDKWQRSDQRKGGSGFRGDILCESNGKYMGETNGR